MVPDKNLNTVLGVLYQFLGVLYQFLGVLYQFCTKI